MYNYHLYWCKTHSSHKNVFQVNIHQYQCIYEAKDAYTQLNMDTHMFRLQMDSYNGIQASPDIEKQFKGQQGCYDLDECLVGVLKEKDRHYIPHACVANSYCENTAGSYQCICDEGYEGQFLTYDSYCMSHIK